MGLAENINALLVKFDINQDALARVAEVSPSTVTRWKQGSSIRDDALNRIITYFDLTKDDLVSDNFGLAAKEKGGVLNAIPIAPIAEDATVPLLTLGRVHAGALTDEDVVSRLVHVPAPVIDAHPNCIALEVEGDCMSRVIPEGSIVVLDPTLEPHNGSIVVVETQDYEAVLRRWYLGSSTLMLVADSYNKQDDITFIGDEHPIRVVGVVVWWQAAKMSR